MAAIGWRRFKFFDDVRHTEASLPEGVTATTSGQDEEVWLGCRDGLVVCLDRDLAVKVTFPAFKGHVHSLLIEGGKLLALGEETDGIKTLTIKAWDVARLRSGITPPTIAAAKVFAASKLPEGEVQAIALSAQQWPLVHLALGTSTGAVYLFKGDAVKGRLTAPFGRYLLRGAAAAAGVGGSGGGISALHFLGSGAQLHVFAVSRASLAALSAATGQVLLEDDCGAGPGCSAVTPSQELLIAAPDAVFFYTAEEGKKAAAGIKGDKHSVAAFKRSVCAVVPDDSTADAESGSGDGAVLRVFDVSNKVIGASVGVELPMRWVVSCGTSIVAADASGRAVRLWQKPLHERLDALYRSRSFQLALRIAQDEHADPKTLAEVRRHFGDFLYSKRDYDAAATQYTATVGNLEPSYVIQRFLDAQRINNLTTYLEGVHTAGIATADHTTLLLNCLAKLRDVAKIDAFVQTTGSGGNIGGSAGGGGSNKTGEGGVLRYDARAAIAVLRSAGYPDQALFVALAAGETNAYLDVLLEDCQRYEDALQYIRGLGRGRGADALHRYGAALLQGDSVATTALLMELCLPRSSSSTAGATVNSSGSGSGSNGGNGNSSRADVDANFVANLADFTHLYTTRPDDLRYACVTILAMGPPDLPSQQALYHTLLDLYLGGNGGTSSNISSSSKKGPQQSATELNITDTTTAGGGAKAPPPQQQTSQPNLADQAAALDLLRRGWPPGQDPAYDVDRALTLCRLHTFYDGLVFLYSNLRMFREAAAVLADAKDWDGLLEACESHGNAASGGDPEIWHDALERVSALTAGPGADAALRELLVRIEASGAMPPLVVLPVLARNPHLRLELVRDYVTRALQSENRAIAADIEEAERLKSEVAKTEAAVRKLTTEPVVFQASKDSQTNAPLELPSVHFLCGHSFNLRTLGDGEFKECPLCAPEHRRVRDLQRSYRSSAADKDGFFRQLRAAPDGFALVAEYFGKGLLNNTSVTAHNQK